MVESLDTPPQIKIQTIVEAWLGHHKHSNFKSLNTLAHINPVVWHVFASHDRNTEH